MATLTEDQAHVLWDAVGMLRTAIRNGATPWSGYVGDPSTDPKLTRDGYLAVLSEAEATLAATMATRANG